MFRNLTSRLIIILVILALAIWVVASNTIKIGNPFKIGEYILDRDVSTHLGLDLRGGLQVVMEADLAADVAIQSEQMDIARSIIENRTNALGVAENSITVAGDRRILGEFPGLQDSSTILETIQKTGVLEFVDFGDVPLEPGTEVQTDFGTTGSGTEGSITPVPAGVSTPTRCHRSPPLTAATPAATETATPANPTVYHTVMTGQALSAVSVSTGAAVGDPTLDYVVNFELTSDWSTVFADYTGSNTEKFLGIVLDKKVISSPRIPPVSTRARGIFQVIYLRERQ